MKQIIVKKENNMEYFLPLFALFILGALMMFDLVDRNVD